MAQTIPVAVGIDLGTTYSVIAHVDAHGEPKSIPNAEGDLLTPSAVLFEESSIIIGKEVQRTGDLEPDGLAIFVKRDMGDPFYHRPLAGQNLPPEVIQSLILAKLKHDAEKVLGPISKAVITVPAYFNEPRRKATQDAGMMADLDVIDIINEPTAAAIAYGRRHGFLNERGEATKRERILVFDLGGGTFDVTVMELDGHNYQTLATGGDVYLGGIDFDHRLVDFASERLLAKHRISDPRGYPAAMQRLLREADDVKRTLTARKRATFAIDHAGKGVRIAITRDEFESMTEDLLMRTIFTVRSVMKQAGLRWDQMSRILLVGGATRMPAVRRRLAQEFAVSVDSSVSTDEAVAHGAALYANMLVSKEAGIEPQMAVVNVNSHNLGVLGRDRATKRMRNAVIIPANTPLPVVKGKQFRTGRENQRSVKVTVVEGGTSSGENATRVADCIVRDLPKGLAAGTAVEVRFAYRPNGRLTVKARIPVLNKEAKVTVQRKAGLSNEAFEEWKKQLQAFLSKLA